MNVRAFSTRVKQKANSPKVVSKETVLNASVVQTKKKVTMGGDLPQFCDCHYLAKDFYILSSYYTSY